MIEQMARRYGKAPWEITGSRTRGAPAWMQRYAAWIALSSSVIEGNLIEMESPPSPAAAVNRALADMSYALGGT